MTHNLEPTVEGSLAWSAYTDPTHLKKEISAMASMWHYIGHTSHFDHGPQRAKSVLGDLWVVREDDGAYQCFADVCPHRGHPLDVIETSSVSFRCRYHGWRFDSDGKLTSGPRLNSDCSSQCSMIGYEVDSIHDLVFVRSNSDGQGETLQEYLGPLLSDLEKRGVDISTLRHHERFEFEANANWKLVVENFLECYHCSNVHPELAATINTRLPSYQMESHDGQTLVQAGPPKNSWPFTEREVDSLIADYVFPGLAVNAFPGVNNLSIGAIVPMSAGNTYRFLDYFFAESWDKGEADSSVEIDKKVIGEDREVIEACQRRYQQHPHMRSSLLAESESLILSFQKRCQEMLD